MESIDKNGSHEKWLLPNGKTESYEEFRDGGPGWFVHTISRKKTSSVKFDRYYISPEGHRFRSLIEVKRHSAGETTGKPPHKHGKKSNAPATPQAINARFTEQSGESRGKAERKPKNPRRQAANNTSNSERWYAHIADAGKTSGTIILRKNFLLTNFPVLEKFIRLNRNLHETQPEKLTKRFIEFAVHNKYSFDKSYFNFKTIQNHVDKFFSPKSTFTVATPNKKQTFEHLKPVYKKGDRVYAAYWWPDGSCLWYPAVVTGCALDKAKKKTSQSKYGPCYKYDLVYDETGIKYDGLEEEWIFSKEDYELTTGASQNWKGVKNVQDAQSNDLWAQVCGWYEAVMDGETQKFTYLAQALRAYDRAIVKKKGAKTKKSDLNLVDDWIFSSSSGRHPPIFATDAKPAALPATPKATTCCQVDFAAKIDLGDLSDSPLFSGSESDDASSTESAVKKIISRTEFGMKVPRNPRTDCDRPSKGNGKDSTNAGESKIKTGLSSKPKSCSSNKSTEPMSSAIVSSDSSTSYAKSITATQRQKFSYRCDKITKNKRRIAGTMTEEEPLKKPNVKSTKMSVQKRRCRSAEVTDNKRINLKPTLNEGDSVVVALDPSLNSRDKSVDWIYASIKKRMQIEIGGPYGTIWKYDVVTEVSGVPFYNLKETQVFPKRDYVLSSLKDGSDEWIGVKRVRDPDSNDVWARNSGWHAALISGRYHHFSLLCDALRARDEFAVQVNGCWTKEEHLNIPAEWMFTSPCGTRKPSYIGIDEKKEPCFVTDPILKSNIPVFSPEMMTTPKTNNADLSKIKPILKLGEQIYARRGCTRKNKWLAGRVWNVRVVEEAGKYGPVRVYDVVFDNGQCENDIEEIYVAAKDDFEVRQYHDDLVGVAHVLDKRSGDEYACKVGWYETNLRGESKVHSSLASALRAYDKYVQENDHGPML